MGFGGWIGGMLLVAFAIVLAIFGLVVLLGIVQFLPVSLDLPFGAIILVIALFLFLYGWYSYQSSKPKGTINVHNV